MSRNRGLDEYEENRKAVDNMYEEAFDDFYEEDQNEQCDNQNYADVEELYLVTGLLKEYVEKQGLPLCQKLNPRVFSEYFEG